MAGLFISGGQTGIRTLEGLAPLPVFKTDISCYPIDIIDKNKNFEKVCKEMCKCVRGV